MVSIEFEHVIADDGTTRIFAHITANKVFGLASTLQAAIPQGVWVSVPPRLQPGITWYLTKHCGFRQIGTVELEDGTNVVLEKDN